jgi:hypothetical protein
VIEVEHHRVGLPAVDARRRRKDRPNVGGVS